MPNDAKLGMVIGIGLVLVIAAVFFRPTPPVTAPTGATPAAVGSDDRRHPAGQHAPASLSRLSPSN